MTKTDKNSEMSVTGSEQVITDVLTKADRDRLRPEDVIERLQAGNARFVAGQPTLRDHTAQISQAVDGQHPLAIVLSCVDSRVPVETILDCGIGDLFVARVAGNFVNPDILGSMEFACKVAGAKAIVVLGHQHCGAVQSAIDGVQLGNITEMLTKINPAVEQTPGHDGRRTSQNTDFVREVTERHAQLTIERIRSESPILADLEAAGHITLVAAICHLETGQVTFLGT